MLITIFNEKYIRLKQLLKDYCKISLLPACGKVFESLIHNKMSQLFVNDNLSSFHQCQW